MLTLIDRAQGDLALHISPAYFQGSYDVVGGKGYAVAVANAAGEVLVPTAVAPGHAQGVVPSGAQRLSLRSGGGTASLHVGVDADPAPLRPRPVPGAQYPCQVRPSSHSL